MSDNIFKTKSKSELEAIIAENMAALLANHITSNIYPIDHARQLAVTLSTSSVIVNAHLVDRVGAIMNALCALGYQWDTKDWNTELLDLKKKE